MRTMFIFLLLLPCVLQCDKDHNDIFFDRDGIVHGTITDSETNLPLEAWVGYDSILDTRNIYSFADSDGYYTYPVYWGRGQLYSGMEGYHSQMKEYQIARGGSLVVNFELISK